MAAKAVVEFPSYAAAFACYHDPVYAEAAKIRHSIADGTQTIIEGSDGTQDFERQARQTPQNPIG